jgi:hypothetical protein
MFCFKCGKCYYEEKIEEGETYMKCPFYKCGYYIDLEIIKRLVTAKHMETFVKKLGNNDNIIILPKKMISDTATPTKSASDARIKLYSQKHVFDITNNESFRYFSKARDQYCGRCFEPALYGKSGKKFVKCLNCLLKLCKFCGKEFSHEHFNIAGFNYCKVYYRKKTHTIQSSKGNNCKEICLGTILFLIGYFLFIVGVFKYISNFYLESMSLEKDNREITNGNKVYLVYSLYSIYFFLMLLSIVLILPLLLFLYPWFSMIVYLWN